MLFYSLWGENFGFESVVMVPRCGAPRTIHFSFIGGVTGLGVRDQYEVLISKYLACLLSWILVRSSWVMGYWCVLHGAQLSLVWLMVLVFIVRWCRILLNTLLVCLQTVSLKEFILFDCFESLLVSGHSLFYVFRPLKSCLFDNLLSVSPIPPPTGHSSHIQSEERRDMSRKTDYLLY